MFTYKIIRYALQFWTLVNVEAAAQHVCRCCRGVLPLFRRTKVGFGFRLFV